MSAPEPSATPTERPRPPARPGTFRLFRFAGTDVFVHWTWFLAAYLLIRDRPDPDRPIAWDAAEYLLGFGLVLLHEFGHVLACRQVGGAADRVVLWPLGGLAYVSPPPRPAAALWTTAAGPLVNLALVPVTMLISALSAAAGVKESNPYLASLLYTVSTFNLIMLVFNLLPVFPLDGGRLLHEALWPWLGRARSLAAAAAIGVVAATGLGGWAVGSGDWWLTAVAAFLALGAVGGLVRAGRLNEMAAAPRRDGRVCPKCGVAPPVGPFWRCVHCRAAFDLFAMPIACQKGGWHETDESCPTCGHFLGPNEWVDVSCATPSTGHATSEIG